MNFDATDKKISDVLFSNYKFRVPRYQRPYAWSEDQVSDFWNDLIENKEPYFLGSFILNYEHWESEQYIDIIDGQQRTLTITIFSAILRDNVKDIDLEFAKKIHRQDIMFEDRNDATESARVLPGETTNPYFEENIQKFDNQILLSNPRSTEEKKIKKVYEYLYEKVQTELTKFDSNESKLKLIKELRKKIADLIVIHVKIVNEEDAYEIFETTNARGVDLSVSDLLKNLIFKKMPARENRDIAKANWRDITNNIEETNTEVKRFLRYFWLSKYAYVSEKSLFREIKRKVADWSNLLNTLLKDSENWHRLMDGTAKDFQKYKHGVKIQKSIFAIKLMGVMQTNVLFLSILRNYEKLDTSPLRIIQIIEKFTFQYSAVSKKPGNKVENIYSKYAIKIENAVTNNDSNKVSAVVQKIFSALEKELILLLPSRESFLESFETLSYKNSEKGRMLVKYILSEINSHLMNTKEYGIDFYNVNIEHILPQKPHRDWNLMRKEVKTYVNLLGNLTLLSKKINSKVQNHTIDRKKPYLDKSELAITKDLLKFIEINNNDWNEEYIKTRHKELGELAIDHIWKI